MSGQATTERSKAFAGRPPEGDPPPQKEKEKENEELGLPYTDADGPFVLIENTKPKMFGIGMPQPSVAKDGVATGVISRDPDLKLQPGMNKVPKKMWDAALTQKMVALHKKHGIFREHGDATNLEKMLLDDCERIIPKTFDRRFLGEWARVDKRVDVQKLLKEQFDLLKRQRRDTDAAESDFSP